jgi:lysophospholipase L1-like esterase
MATVAICVALVAYAATGRSAGNAPAFVAPSAASGALSAARAPLAVLWLGDSFVNGDGADGMNYPSLLAPRLGWVVNRDAQGGSGFVADGRRANPSYTRLIDRLDSDTKRYTADLVIIDAGRNDNAVPAAKLNRAIRKYLRAVHTAYPNARIAVVLPTFLTPANPDLLRIGESLKRLAAPYDAVIIDPVGGKWVKSPAAMRRFIGPDHTHPNQSGQHWFADHFFLEFKANGLADLIPPPAPF